METSIGHYELLYIIPARFTNEETVPIQESVKRIFSELGGELVFEENWGKKRFAYPIKQQYHGYYSLLRLSLPKEQLKEVNRKMGLLKEVMRYQILAAQLKTPEELSKERQEKEKRLSKIEAEKTQQRKKEERPTPKFKETTIQKPIEIRPGILEEDKVSLEELDKKLDEILDTKDIV